MDTSLAMEALQEALMKDSPDRFNTALGSQFTRREFTRRLTEASIEISMDGLGRATDNVFIDRLWRTMKHEKIYLKESSSGVETNSCLSRFFDYYGHDARIRV
jgi:putative transposase